jgi:hypothetical protein
MADLRRLNCQFGCDFNAALAVRITSAMCDELVGRIL